MTTRSVTTFAGGGTVSVDGIGTSAQIRLPMSIVVTPDGQSLLVHQTNEFTIRHIDISTKLVTIFCDQGLTSGNAWGLAVSPDGKKVLVAQGSNLKMIDATAATPRQAITLVGGSTVGNLDGVGTAALFQGLSSVVFDPTGDGSWALVGDRSTVRVVELASGKVTTIAGTLVGVLNGNAVGSGAQMRVNSIYGMAFSPDGLAVYLSDHNNRRIKRISLCRDKVRCFAH